MKKGKKSSPQLWWGALIFLLFLLVVLFFLFLVVFFSDDPQWMSSRLGAEPRGEGKYKALKFLGIGMGGLLVALQALMSYRRATAMEDAANAQAEATENQAQANQTAEQGQRQERLKNAIEHLGNASDSVRLGGAYELFHLAEDAEDSGQRQTVLDILCAHIRWTTGEPGYRKKHPSKPSEEIQSLLTLLFVQEHQVFTGLRINLQESWLNGVNLSRARLARGVLERAWLHGARLIGTQLHEARLQGAQLHGAYLRDAQLHGAYLTDAQLHGASLEGARLHGAYLRDAQLHGADLADARLHGAILWGTQLHGAILADAQLHGAHLQGAQLHEAILMGAQLHGVSSGTRFAPESFEAFINERIGEKCNLLGATFAGGLTREDVESVGIGLPEERAKRLRDRLEGHIGPRIYRPPLGIVASAEGYTKEEAAQWIAEYKTATAAVSRSG